MKSISPYLNFNGNAEEAFAFYRSVFGGEFLMIQRFKDMPEAEKTVSSNEMSKIMHVSLPLGKVAVLMGSDAPESRGMRVTFGNSFHISLEAESEAEAIKIFKALSAGGDVKMPLQRQFWGAWYGQVVDKFGVSWMINFTP